MLNPLDDPSFPPDRSCGACRRRQHLVCATAHAQIGNIFSDQPRPPGGVPRGSQQAPEDEEEVPELPRGRLLPTPNRALPRGRACHRRERDVTTARPAAGHNRDSAKPAAEYRGDAAAARPGRRGRAARRQRSPGQRPQTKGAAPPAPCSRATRS